jgi:sugar/nucleoside kinase (ribokinase family)
MKQREHENPDCIFLGRATLDLLYLVEQFPTEDTKTMAGRFLAQAGGPALNAAIAFAFLGGKPLLVSAIGNGPWADMVKTELQTYGVPYSDIGAAEFAPPVSSVVINARSGSRTIFNAPAAPVTTAVEAVPVQSPLVLVDGFYTAELGGWVRGLAAGGATVCLDGGSWKADTKELLSLVSIAICSERFHPPGTENCCEVLRYLAGSGIRRAAITRGAAEILGLEDGREFRVEMEPAAAVDTLGAGDILHGAFCRSFLSTGNFEESLRQSSRIATLSCRFFGAREWMRHWHRGGE